MWACMRASVFAVTPEGVMPSFPAWWSERPARAARPGRAARDWHQQPENVWGKQEYTQALMKAPSRGCCSHPKLKRKG